MLRPAAPGEGWCARTRTPSPGAVLARPGRPLRAHDLGMLAAAGVTTLPACARAHRGDRLDRRRARAGRPRRSLGAGQVRDATATALAALVHEAGGSRCSPGSCRTTSTR